MTAIYGLGADFDILHGITPINLGAGNNTGARINMMNYAAVTFVGYFAVGAAAEPPTMTLQEHTALTGGTSTNLVVIDEYWQKEELALDGDEQWEKVTQTAAATVTDATWDDANEVLVAFTVNASQLSDTYTHLSVNVADIGGAITEKPGMVLAIGYGLRVQRTPANLVQPNA